ncbi:MAG: PAS domain S-box protein [Proteobacteria bacterium]|nr:PAS domain S-box protein [Pseudomonadota bacterium]
MKDPSSINPELIEEISVLKQRIKELEQSESDRKQAEEELRESEEKYRVLFEGMNDAVFVHDLDERGLPGRFLQVNDVACRRLGYTRDELLSLTPRDITMPEEYERIADKRTGLTSQGDILAETIHVTKDGREIPVESNIRQFQYLGRRVALSISRDITERKQAEEEIQRIKTAVDATGDAIGMSTADGHHFYQNEAFDHLFGYTQEEVSRLHPAKLYGNKDIVKKVFETIMAGKSWHGEIEMVAKTGDDSRSYFEPMPSRMKTERSSA